MPLQCGPGNEHGPCYRFTEVTVTARATRHPGGRDLSPACGQASQPLACITWAGLSGDLYIPVTWGRTGVTEQGGVTQGSQMHFSNIPMAQGSVVQRLGLRGR